MSEDARVINGRLYTIRRVVETHDDICPRSQRMPWALYRDGDRVGYFRLKKDGWRAADMLAYGDDTDATRRARQVEREQALKGAQLLDRIALWFGKRS